MVREITHSQLRHVIGLDGKPLKWHEAVEAVLAAKDGPCIDCGQCYPRCAMDFDHVYGEKLFTIAQATNGQRRPDWAANPLNISPAELFAEAEKCQLRCSNCHRIATSERRRKAYNDKAEWAQTYLPVCVDCDGPIVRWAKRGRTPKRCSDCRSNRTQRTLFEAA